MKHADHKRQPGSSTAVKRRNRKKKKKNTNQRSITSFYKSCNSKSKATSNRNRCKRKRSPQIHPQSSQAKGPKRTRREPETSETSITSSAAEEQYTRPYRQPWAILRPLNNALNRPSFELTKEMSIFGTDAVKCDFVVDDIYRFGAVSISPIHAKIKVNPGWDKDGPDSLGCLANIKDCSKDGHGIWLKEDTKPLPIQKGLARLLLRDEIIHFTNPENREPISYILSVYVPDNSLWKFNPKYRDIAIQIISQKVGRDVTPFIDLMALEENKQCNECITPNENYFSSRYEDGALGKPWREWVVWVNGPYKNAVLMEIVRSLQRRKMRGLFCGPSNEFWKSTSYYKECIQSSKGNWHLFEVMNNWEYPDVFFPASTNYQKGVGPPPFDVIVFYLDFTE